MRKCLAVISGLFIMMPAFANTNLEALLNKVTLQFTSEQWVTTKTALVTIGISASVSDKGLDKIQGNILDKLNQFASKAEWHIVSFDRSEDQSGLEKVQASAQARLPEAALAGLRDKAKAMSKPGETYTLDNVQFIPSDEELRAANTALRINIYQQVKTELDQLNKEYPEQKYFVHQINFVSQVSPGPLPQQNAMVMTKFGGNGVGASSNFAVGDKLRIAASVVVASAPNQDVTKMVTK